MKPLAIYLMIVASLFAACDTGSKGNLPRIDAAIPLVPGAVSGNAQQSVVKAVPSNIVLNMTTVAITSDALVDELLEFYKHQLEGVQLRDLGGYYSLNYLPPGWSEPDRIEIRIEKNPMAEPVNYLVVQYKRKGGWLDEVRSLFGNRG